MTTMNYVQLVKQLEDKDSNKYVIFMSLRSCIVSDEIPSEDEILESFTKFIEIIVDKDQDLFIRRSAASLITDLCNDHELNLLLKTPKNAIKPLISLLNIDYVCSPILKLLTSLCATRNDQDEIASSYREYILYQTDAVKIIYGIIHKLYESSNDGAYSKMQSFINILISFLPQTSMDIENEDNWFEIYGKNILQGLCEITEISNSDPWTLGEICDGVSIVYVLSADNNLVAANCAAIIKRLIDSGQYNRVKKTGKKAVMSIVIMFYIQQAGIEREFPPELVFQMLKFSGNIK